MNNTIILDEAERVNMYERAKTHPDCSALIIKEENVNNDTMLIK